MSARQSLWVAESGPWAVVSCSPAHRPVNKLSMGQVGCNPAESIGAIAGRVRRSVCKGDTVTSGPAIRWLWPSFFPEGETSFHGGAATRARPPPNDGGAAASVGP
ncbi:hypothetical protein BHE74_00014605 [Ensete ventricosum]|nr:hypothetical protein BHE74_00014605 [Ensete ventricosum]